MQQPSGTIDDKNTAENKLRSVNNEVPLILGVDDSPEILRTLQGILSERYRFLGVPSGQSALKVLELHKPDLFIFDIDMPNMDGLELAQKAQKILQQAGFVKDIPVIFLTSREDIEFELQAFDIGAVDYINKPFSPQLLLKRVHAHMKQELDKKTLSEDNKEKTKTIRGLQSAIVYTLADLVEMRDHSTGGHVFRTQKYFSIILDYLAEQNIYQDILRNMDRRLLLEASQLHDVGKVAIPDAILLKPGRLTIQEFEVMKTHTTIGYNAIRRAMSLTSEKEFLGFASEVALSHHEHWDGTGYPNMLAGTDIPIAARIMAIVDVYDALSSERHYKSSMTHEESMQIIVSERGTHFDPILIDACCAVNEKFQQVAQIPNQK